MSVLYKDLVNLWYQKYNNHLTNLTVINAYYVLSWFLFNFLLLNIRHFKICVNPIQITFLILDSFPPPFLYMGIVLAVFQSDGAPPCFIKISECFSDCSV